MGKYSGNTANKFLNIPNSTLGIYNAWDVQHTSQLAGVLLSELRDNHQLEYYFDVVEPLQEAVVAMQARGMLLDADAKCNYKAKLSRELNSVDAEILCIKKDQSFNANSTTQVAKWLFNDLGLKWLKKTAGGKPSTDQEALTWVLRNLRKKDQPCVPALHALFHRSRVQTLYERYLNFEADTDGRVRARVKMAKAKTSRFAYENPALQQFPPEVRHMFVATPGHTFLSVDYSQLEARLLAYIANDTTSIDVFKHNGDVHTANAAKLFHKAANSITTAERNYAKSFLYRITYGGEGSEKEKTSCPCVKWGCGDKLPAVVDLKRSDKLTMERRWFAAHPAVKTYQNALLRSVKRDGYYDHPLGGRRYFDTPYGNELEREVKNEPMQRGGATLMARAQIELHNNYNAPIVLQMHDEFMLEVPTAKTSYWAEIVQGVMEKHIPELNTSIPTDIAIGTNWGKHSTSNPNGLKDIT